MKRIRRTTAAALALLVAASCSRGGAPPNPANVDPSVPVDVSAADAGARSCAAPYASGPTPVENSSFPGKLGDVVTADVDNDGNLDIVFANGNDVGKGNVHVLYGPFAGGRPAATWSSNANNYYRRLAVGDIDGDGDLDIAVAIQPGSFEDCPGADAGPPPRPGRLLGFPKSLACDGREVGGATPGVAAWLGPPNSPDQPLAVAIFRSDGGSRDFGAGPKQVFAYRAPPEKQALIKKYPLGAVSVDFGDYNGDGHLDLAVAGGNVNARIGVPVQVLENDGRGNFQSSATHWRSKDEVIAFSVRFLDWNGDGLVDLLATTQYGTQWAFLFEGMMGVDSRPTLSDVDSKPPFFYPLSCALVGASDAITVDGGIGVVAAAVNAKRAQVREGQPAIPGVLVQQGMAAPLPIPFEPPYTAGIRFADLDGDSRADLVVPNWARDSETGEKARAGPVFCVDHALEPGLPEALPGHPFFAQGVAVGDLDNASRLAGSITPPSCDADSAPRRFVVPIQEPNVQTITGVVLDGHALAPTRYSGPPGSRLVYVAGGFACTQPPTVRYTYSRSPDIVVGDFSTCGAPLEVFFHAR